MDIEPMRMKLLLLSMACAVAIGFLRADEQQDRYVLIAIGDGADYSNRMSYAQWVNAKLGDLSDRASVIAIWTRCARVRSIAHTNQLAWMRCVNIDRLHGAGRWAKIRPDEQLESKAYQAATNIMGSDSRFVWIDVTTDASAWESIFERVITGE